MKSMKKWFAWLLVISVAMLSLTVGLADDVGGEATAVPETPVPETPVPETPVPETPVPETPVPETPVPEETTPVPVEETPAPVEETPVPEEATPVPETPATPEAPAGDAPAGAPEIVASAPSESVEPEASETPVAPAIMLMALENEHPYVYLNDESQCNVSSDCTVDDIVKAITDEGWNITQVVVEAAAHILPGGTGLDLEYEVVNNGEIGGGSFGKKVTNNGTINAGVFKGEVLNQKTINDGDFDKSGSVTNTSEIIGGSFEGTVISSGTISGGSFYAKVTNESDGQIAAKADGTKPKFEAEVQNKGTISNGSFTGQVTNDKTIQGGTFDGEVINHPDHELGKGATSSATYNAKVTNEGTISAGLFATSSTINNSGTINGSNENLIIQSNTVDNTGTILSGQFNGFASTITVNNLSTDSEKGIRGGTFSKCVINNKTSAHISAGSFDKNCSILNENNGVIEGTATFSCGQITNKGVIKGGTFRGTSSTEKSTVFNGKDGYDGLISGGEFREFVIVENNSSIEGGTYKDGCQVRNLPPRPTPTPDMSTADPRPTETPVPPEFSAGTTISGGTFEEGSELQNYQTVTGLQDFNGEVFAHYDSTMTDCTFEKKAKAHLEDAEYGAIKVKQHVNGSEQEYNFGAHVYNKAEGGLGEVTNGVWLVNEETDDRNQARQVTPAETIPPQEWYYYSKTNAQSNTNPSGGNPNSGSGSGSGNGSGSGDTSTPDYNWGSGTSSSPGTNLSPKEGIVQHYLDDGSEEISLDIVHNGGGIGLDYELIDIEPKPIATPEPATNTVDTGDTLYIGVIGRSQPTAVPGHAVMLDEEGEPVEEESKLIPGEVEEDEDKPGMMYVRAKGLGTEPRVLSLRLSQLSRAHETQKADVLLFRNGTATVSMDLNQFFEGKIPKLLEMMRSWAYQEESFDDYDLEKIDFDAIEDEPEIDDSVLKEFTLEITIEPAVPVGYMVRVDLALGEDSMEISPLLEKMGVTLHAETVTDNVGVYYMNEDEERTLLDTHRGTVPYVDDRVTGYEVTYSSGSATVLALDRSVEEGEFSGLCAKSGGAGTYYIGVLPTDTPTPGPDASSAPDETPEPTETPAPTETPEPQPTKPADSEAVAPLDVMFN